MLAEGKFRFIVLLCALTQFFPTSTRAENWQTAPLLESLRGSLYEFRFLVEGLKSVHSFGFKDDTTAKYQPFLNRMVLGVGVADEAHRLRSFSAISLSDFGTLAHESFHAYKANFIDRDESLKPLKLWMKRRAYVLYGELSANKRETALEEAYAVFIDNAITARISAVNSMKRATPENCERYYQTAQHIWKIGWGASVVGYFYRDSVSEYWADKFRGFFRRLSGGDVEGEDRAIEVSESLTAIDKAWIAENLLERKVSPSFARTFEIEGDLFVCK
jgi:hypothetical protein